MKRLMVAVFSVVLPASLSVCMGVSPDAPAGKKRPEVRISNVRWQALPDELQVAYTGPDGRLWCTYGDSLHTTEQEARAELRRAFTNKSPVLKGCEIRLFGPGKMVWVSYWVSSCHCLLGYDGKRFVSYKLPAGQGWTGQCRSKGQGYWSPNRWCRANAVADGKAFFLADRGVHCFDGRQWSFKQVHKTSPHERNYPCLAASPDGKGLVLYAPNSNLAWRWWKGKWTEFLLPLVEKEYVVAAAPARPDGVWIATNLGIRFAPYPKPIPPPLVKWIAQLGHDDWKVRVKATEQLKAYGPTISLKLRGAMKDARDPEIKLRLELILSSFQTKTKPGQLVIGTLRLRRPKMVFYDRLGRMFLTSKKITRDGTVLGPGLVVVASDKRCEVLPGKKFTECFISEHSTSLPLLADTRGRLIWTPGNLDDRPPKLLCLDKKDFIATFPNARFPWLQTVTPDGSVVVSIVNCGCLVAYNYRAPENRTFLKAREFELRNDDTCYSNWIAPDGSIWAVRKDRRLVRFKNGQWKPVPALEKFLDVRAMIVGQNETVLMIDHGLYEKKKMYVMATPKAVYTARTVEELIQTHHKEFSAAFSCKNRPRYLMTGLSVVVDKAGNIWLGKDLRLKVFDGIKWFDVVTELKKTGLEVKYATLMYALDDGKKVCFSDRRLTFNKGRSHIGSIRDGKFVFSPASDAYKRFHFLRDHSGGLWFAGFLFNKRGERLHRCLPYRVTDKGAKAYPGASFPVLADPGGSVWMAHAWDQPFNTYRIWRNGKYVQTLQIRGSMGTRRVFSDAPGSVWIWADFGLQHWTADPAGGGKFTHRKTYTVPGIKGRVGRVQYSPSGFLVISTNVFARDGICKASYLYLVRLPDGQR